MPKFVGFSGDRPSYADGDLHGMASGRPRRERPGATGRAGASRTTLAAQRRTRPELPMGDGMLGR